MMIRTEEDNGCILVYVRYSLPCISIHFSATKPKKRNLIDFSFIAK